LDHTTLVDLSVKEILDKEVLGIQAYCTPRTPRFKAMMPINIKSMDENALKIHQSLPYGHRKSSNIAVMKRPL
jgi:hypothetical protein